MTTDCTGKQVNSKSLEETICSDHSVQNGTKTLKTPFRKIFPSLGDTSLTKQQFVITHTIHHAEIPTLLDSSVVHKKITGP